jgi:AcrR family transcriptional regulator
MAQESGGVKGSSLQSRPYRMRKRAKQVDGTKLRIVEAAVELHGTVGPAATTFMGVAAHAGVTRATVYRHFPDESALFDACSSHWLAQQQPPDPSTWAGVADPVERMRVGLTDLYRFYRSGQQMLSRIYRDKAWLPERHRVRLETRGEQARDLLLAAFPTAKKRQRRLRAAVGHAVDFWTWHSLCSEHGLTNPVAVELMLDLAAAAAR